jgi:putative flippase GtrA
MRQHARRFSLFASVGAINTLIDFASFLLLYDVVGLGVVPSNVAAFAIAVTNSYVLNRTLTFADRSSGARLHSTGAKFVAIALVGLAVSTAIVYATSLFMHPLFGKPLASLASLFIGYVGSHLFVFPQKT